MKFALYLVAFLLKSIRFSCRKKIFGLENFQAAKDMAKNGNYALAIWHRDLFTCLLNMREFTVSMTSQSKDGQLAADLAHLLGKIRATRGSSSKGGKSAMNEMISICNDEKLPAGLTVDGPRGPAQEPKRGLFKIAYECQMPILPYYGISSRMKVLYKSWDKFRFGMPFSTFYIYYGKPFLIESLDEDKLEEYAQRLKESLIELEDRHFENFPKHKTMIQEQIPAT